uniref:Uncharacterized protein n=1 Tax=Ciona savignyi TaxID=51511 RepID=H2ZP95_CIOSA
MEKQNYELVYKENFIKKKEYTPGGLGPDEQDIKDSMEYKQVATCGEKVLKFGPPAASHYHVSQNFEQYVL